MLSCLQAPSNIVGCASGLLQLEISTKAAHGNFERDKRPQFGKEKYTFFLKKLSGNFYFLFTHL